MSKSTTIEWLTTAIGQAARSARFCVVGCLPPIDPGLAVEGLGAIRLPLKRKTAKALVALGEVAPYGKGTQTLVNKKVRNTVELDPKKFRVSDAWNSAIAQAMGSVAEQLGLPAEQLEARLYKLLVYEKGGFFLPHRDSEKHDRMVASLVVVLPNRFEGGKLIVRHGAAKQELNFEEAAHEQTPCYAAFYADCEHEVQRVTHGVRLCLAYNLVLKPKRVKPSSAKQGGLVDAVAESLRSWFATQPAQPLVFALEHHYTERGLSLDLLKGTDRQLAGVIVSAGEQTACLVHLAQVSRHLMQFADDGSFERSYYRSYQPRRELEIGETYEDELSGTHWTDVAGREQPWKEIAFDPSAIVSSVPLDDWKPTSETFEGYTGNEGNTLDRWYHRSALVLWQRAHHFDVIASSGTADSIPLFCSMAAKLAKTPKKRFEEARLDCLRFARAIIASWPQRVLGFRQSALRDTSPDHAFLENLLTLHDRETIALFLSKLAERDQTLPLNSLVVAACREFGWYAFAQELKQLIAARSSIRGREEMAFRDVEWLSAFCCDKTVDPERSTLTNELCAQAVERFCEPRPPRPSYYSPFQRRETSASAAALPLLLQALAATGRDEDMARVIRFVQALPDEFSLDDCQVPCLKLLIPWSRKRFDSVLPPLAAWLVSVRQQLEAATVQQPAAPTDWSRPADIACSCQYCAQLKTFLADPTNEVGRIPAREDMRNHVIGTISQHQCDVKYTLERKGSPYSLALTKTNGSFERAVQRFKANCQLLSALPPTV